MERVWSPGSSSIASDAISQSRLASQKHVSKQAASAPPPPTKIVSTTTAATQTTPDKVPATAASPGTATTATTTAATGTGMSSSTLPRGFRSVKPPSQLESLGQEQSEQERVCDQQPMSSSSKTLSLTRTGKTALGDGASTTTDKMLTKLEPASNGSRVMSAGDEPVLLSPSSMSEISIASGQVPAAITAAAPRPSSSASPQAARRSREPITGTTTTTTTAIGASASGSGTRPSSAYTVPSRSGATIADSSAPSLAHRDADDADSLSPVDHSRPSDWYKTMFNRMHKYDKRRRSQEEPIRIKVKTRRPKG